jgi:hypothetical protein
MFGQKIQLIILFACNKKKEKNNFHRLTIKTTNMFEQIEEK